MKHNFLDVVLEPLLTNTLILMIPKGSSHHLRPPEMVFQSDYEIENMGLSENVGYIPNEIAISKRDNDQQNHWVFRATNYFQLPTHMLDVCLQPEAASKSPKSIAVMHPRRS